MDEAEWIQWLGRQLVKFHCFVAVVGATAGEGSTRRLVSGETLRKWRYSIAPRSRSWNRSSTPDTCARVSLNEQAQGRVCGCG